jgi:hypothetical protein
MYSLEYAHDKIIPTNNAKLIGVNVVSEKHLHIDTNISAQSCIYIIAAPEVVMLTRYENP